MKLFKWLDKLGDAMLRPINTSAGLILGFLTITWGLWVASPFWDVFSSAKIYSTIDYVPEVWIGIAAIVTGVITTYGALRSRPPYVYWGSAAAGMFWFAITLCYMTGDWRNTGGIVSLYLSLYGGYIYLNVKINNKR